MAAVQCLSCEHDNPPGARFCQECGSALNLKLCKQCEAINESNAQRCHKCDAPFAAPPAAERKKKTRLIAPAALIAAVAGLASYVAYSVVYRQPAAVQAAAEPALPAAATPAAAPAAASPQPLIQTRADAAPPPVTHTRAAAAPPPVTHTRRAAVMTTGMKRESN